MWIKDKFLGSSQHIQQEAMRHLEKQIKQSAQVYEYDSCTVFLHIKKIDR